MLQCPQPPTTVTTRGQHVLCLKLDGEAALLYGEDFPARGASEESLDVAARNEPFDLAIGERGVWKGSLAFGIGPKHHEAVKPPARFRSVGQIGFTEQEKQYPSRPNIGPQLRHQTGKRISWE